MGQELLGNCVSKAVRRSGPEVDETALMLQRCRRIARAAPQSPIPTQVR